MSDRVRFSARAIGRTQHDVGEDLVLGHLDVADGNTQAENLLELELDRRADLSNLVGQVLSVGHGGGELASCIKGQNTERARCRR